MLRMSFYFPNFGTAIFRLYMLKKELRKILLSLSFVFVAAVSCAQYVVTGGSGSPMKATQSSGDSAERLEVYLVYGMDNVTISYTSSSSSSHQWYRYKTKRLEAEKVASTKWNYFHHSECRGGIWLFCRGRSRISLRLDR